ncbi:MAG TPA: glycosyltransferase [Terriglobia bacterium]|nr:glycosyltransferase [Terriglobia bacterium]
MLQQVDVGPRSLEAYRGIAPDDLVDDLLSASKDFKGARVVHVNATPYGGGVSEILRSAVPILNNLGLVAHWKTIVGDSRFFEVTKKIHNGLQGAPDDLTGADREAYLGTSRRNAKLFEEDYDFVFLHDPQPAGILHMHGKRAARWIWRCHIDTSSPNPNVWSFLRGHMTEFDAAVFTMRKFVPPDFPVSNVDIFPPAIDPLSPKNMPLADDTARQVLQWIGIDLDRPLITQVSRFDPWKDPMGVIEVYKMLRGEFPLLQLALVGSMALDDPEGWEMYRRIMEEVGRDSDIHVFTNLIGVGNVEVNAFQRLSRVVIQKSIREGFGLVVSEAMWKATPVVAGNAGGIPLQMADGVGGMLVESTQECAAAVRSLLADPNPGHDLARRGRERVRRHFLLPRLLLNELRLMKAIASGHGIPDVSSWSTRDPVCGLLIRPDDLTAVVEGQTFRFCSDYCRSEFVRHTQKYRIN